MQKRKRSGYIEKMSGRLGEALLFQLAKLPVVREIRLAARQSHLRLHGADVTGSELPEELLPDFIGAHERLYPPHSLSDDPQPTEQPRAEQLPGPRVRKDHRR